MQGFKYVSIFTRSENYALWVLPKLKKTQLRQKFLHDIQFVYLQKITLY